MCDNRLRLLHPSLPRAFIGRGEWADAGIKHHATLRTQRGAVGLHLCIRPHLVVHRGHNEDGALGSEQGRREELVGMPVRSPREEVSGGGGDDHEIGLARQPDMIEGVPVTDQHGVYGTPCQSLERDRPDELPGRPREDYVNLGSGLREQAREPGGLITRNPPGHPEENATAIEGTHEARRVKA
jgi:hypothetical protein